MVIGLTGGIASGKSTVARMMEKLGAVIIDADKISHKVLKKGQPGYLPVIKKFGNGIISKNGEIDREELGNIVFEDPAQKKRLEQILHPLIITEIKNKIKEYETEDRIVVVDAPLLFETNLENLFDKILVVYCDKNTQLKRLIKRNNIDLKKAKNMINSQISLKKKKKLADIVIDNRGTKEKLRQQVLLSWREINEDKKNCTDSS